VTRVEHEAHIQGMTTAYSKSQSQE